MPKAPENLNTRGEVTASLRSEKRIFIVGKGRPSLRYLWAFDFKIHSAFFGVLTRVEAIIKTESDAEHRIIWPPGRW